MLIFREHQEQLRTDENWNGKQHQRRNGRDKGKTGHLDGFVGGEQGWRSVGVEIYKEKHQFAILPERLRYQMKMCATFSLPENSNIILIECLVGPLFLWSNLSRLSTNSLLRVVSGYKNTTGLKQNGFLVILRHVQKDILSLVFIIYDCGFKALPAKSRIRSLIMTEINAQTFAINYS